MTVQATPTVRLELPTMDVIPVRGSFEDLYRLEYPGLVAVATALTGDGRDGEDMVQDTMVKAFVHWRRVSRLARPGAWCHHVLTNACRSLWRRRGSERRYVERMRRHEPSITSAPEDVLAFWAVVRALPQRPRMVVALHYAGDRTMADIATILGVPEGTVRSDIARARTLIVEQLGGAR
jgi:RNA polymerase sigma-70 factor (ECF subfamily)